MDDLLDFEYPESRTFLLAFVYLIIVLCRHDDLRKPMNVYITIFTDKPLLGIAYLKLNRAMTDFLLAYNLAFWGGVGVPFCRLPVSGLGLRVCGGLAQYSPLNPSGKSYDWGKYVAPASARIRVLLDRRVQVISIAGNFILFHQASRVVDGKNPKVQSLAIYFAAVLWFVGLFSASLRSKPGTRSRKLRIISRVMIPLQSRSVL